MAGCRHHDSPSDIARVRVIDAFSGGEELVVSADGMKRSAKLRYRDSSGYNDVKPGTYKVHIGPTYQRKPLVTLDVKPFRGEMYTLIALPASEYGGSLIVKVLQSKAASPAPKDQAQVRFASAAPDFDDLTISFNNVIALDGVKFGMEAPTITLAPGDYQLKLWRAGQVPALLGPISVHLEPGHAYTIVAMGRLSDKTLAIPIYDDGK